jgi:hypothetical protein
LRSLNRRLASAAFGILTPVNELLRHTVTRMAKDGSSPGLFTEEQLLGRITKDSSSA